MGLGLWDGTRPGIDEAIMNNNVSILEGIDEARVIFLSCGI